MVHTFNGGHMGEGFQQPLMTTATATPLATTFTNPLLNTPANAMVLNADVQALGTLRQEIAPLIDIADGVLRLSEHFFGRFNVPTQSSAALAARSHSDRAFAGVANRALNHFGQEANESNWAALVELVIFFILEESGSDDSTNETQRLAADYRDGVVGLRSIYLRGHLVRLRLSAQGKRERPSSDDAIQCSICRRYGHTASNCPSHVNNRGGGGRGSDKRGGGNGRGGQGRRGGGGGNRQGGKHHGPQRENAAKRRV